MTTSPTFDTLLERVSAGEPLATGDIAALAASPDILQVGMLADAWRRRVHGTRTTYLRVASCEFDRFSTTAVPPAAREVRITGTPESMRDALAAVEQARAVAGDRTVAGFSWTAIETLAGDRGGLGRVLSELRKAGLDAVAVLALDTTADVRGAVEYLGAAGFTQLRLGIDKAGGADRLPLLSHAGELQQAFGSIQTINPLPATLSLARPTTGYEDVKMLALARLAAPAVPSIQVDWLRYGPKLAQVALTFGADDLDGVTGVDEAPEGRRRGPLEEVRRNIEAAGFTAVERDGRFHAVA